MDGHSRQSRKAHRREVLCNVGHELTGLNCRAGLLLRPVNPFMHQRLPTASCMTAGHANSLGLGFRPVQSILP